jgi:hypothetical protein
METKKRGRPAKAKEEVKPEENEIEIFRLFVISKCPNPLWVRGMTENKERANIKVPKSTMADKLVGKWINATRIDGEEKTLYNFYS